MPTEITLSTDEPVFTSEVGYYDFHYKNPKKWMTMGGRTLPVIQGRKIARHPGFTAVLLPAEVVRIVGLPSAVAWVKNEPTTRDASEACEQGPTPG